MWRIVLIMLFLSAAGYPADNFLKLLPADTRLYIHADIGAWMKSDLAKTIIRERAWINDYIRQLKQNSGIELTEDLQYLLVGASSDRLDKIAFIIKGRFSSLQVESYLRQHTANTPQLFDGVRVYRLEREGRTLFLALPGEGMVVGAFDWLYLCREIETIAGKGQNALGGAIAGAGQFAAHNFVTAQVIDSGTFLGAVQTLSQSQSLSLGVINIGDKLSGQLDINMKTDQSSQQLFDFAKIMARLAIDRYGLSDQNKDAAGAKAILGNTDFERSGKDITVKSSATAADILSLIPRQKP